MKKLRPGREFPLKREVRITGDGSSTIFVPGLNEHYHSTYGAVQESMYVFIDAGLIQLRSEKIKIFEVGFGTGLNCLLTCKYATAKEVIYHAIEKFSVENDLLSQLNFTKAGDEELFRLIHQFSWNKESEIKPGLTVKKILGDIKEFEPETTYNLIYFDAFAPEVQPELWTTAIFAKMYNMLDEGGILTTYCAKGEVRRTMQRCGFRVERLPGPPGKREMLRVWKE